MTETVATYQLDSLPVNQLPDRYGIGRSAFYERVNALGLQFEKQGNKSIASAEQIDRLDALNNHVQAGKTIASFIDSLPQTEPEKGELAPIQQPELATAMMAFTAAVIHSQRDPLAHIEALQKACDRGWLLSSSELAPLLKLARVSGQEIRRYGFVCTRAAERELIDRNRSIATRSERGHQHIR